MARFSSVCIPVFGGERQGIDGARKVQEIATLGSANVPRRVAAHGSVADRERHQVAGPFATSVESDAFVMAAPLASQSSQNQTLVGHDYLGAGVVHKSPILPRKGNVCINICHSPVLRAIDMQSFVLRLFFMTRVLVRFEIRRV